MARKPSRRRRGQPWKPFQPVTRPPSGSYDPALDQTERAAGRGYQDILADYGTGQGRNEDDYLLANKRLQEHRAQTLQDLLTGHTRETTDRVRQYGILGSNQTQSANAAGLLGGGFAEQAAMKRNANQTREQTLSDQDYNQNVSRTNIATDEQLGDLGLTYQRGNQDAQTAVTRAGRENLNFGADTNEARWFNSRASGYIPPTKPAGEGYRLAQNGQRVDYRRAGQGAYLPSGRYVGNLRRYLRRHGVR